MIDQARMDKWKLWSKGDDWHCRFVGSDVREMLGEIERLRMVLLDCANDLQASVTAEYAGTLDYPVMRRKFERDMEPVNRARLLLGDVVQQQTRTEK